MALAQLSNRLLANGLLGGLVGLTLASGSALVISTHAQQPEQDVSLFVTSLKGSEEVPPVTTSAAGVAAVIVDRTARELQFSVATRGLNNIVGAHIHAGARGSDGPVIFTLSEGSFESPLSGRLQEDDFQAAPDAGILSFDDAMSAITNGNAYINVHTMTHPDGELRGQLRSADEATATQPTGESQ